MKPYIHAKSSARKFGGVPEDYLDIHQLMDCSKGAMPDNRHRAMTHNAWFLSQILERIFGVVRTNSAGKEYSVRDVGEQHVQEDMKGTIPTVCDYLSEMEYKDWMGGAGVPPSHRKIEARKVTTFIPFDAPAAPAPAVAPAPQCGMSADAVFCDARPGGGGLFGGITQDRLLEFKAAFDKSGKTEGDDSAHAGTGGFADEGAACTITMGHITQPVDLERIAAQQGRPPLNYDKD